MWESVGALVQKLVQNEVSVFRAEPASLTLKLDISEPFDLAVHQLDSFCHVCQTGCIYVQYLSIQTYTLQIVAKNVHFGKYLKACGQKVQKQQKISIKEVTAYLLW